MKRLLLLLIVFGALPLFGQGTSFPVFNRQGWTMAGAVVGTCTGPADPGTGTLYCTAPVTTYQDWTLTTPCTNQTTIPNPPGPPLGPTHGAGCTNPGLTDSHGNATIFAANGFYWALISGYQVVPQTFPFDIGAGGGGGGPCPFGALYDIQINDPLGLCGADSGIGLLNPTVHTLYENILNANQQVDVSDATNSGLYCGGHSTGSSVDSAFCFQTSPTFSPTPTGGYGLFPADNAPTAPGQVLAVSSSTPTNVTTNYGVLPFYSQHYVSGVTGLVSCEDWFPVWHCNANAPATTSDITPSNNAQQDNQYLASPLDPTDPASSLIYASNPAACVISSVGTVTCQANPPTPGDTLVVMSYVQCGLGCSGISFVTSDSLSNTWTQASHSDGSGASLPYSLDYAPVTKGGQIDTITVVAAPTGASYNTQTQVFIIKGAAVPDVIGSEMSSVAPTSYSFNALTTTHAEDFLLACVFQNDATSTYVQGSGWYMTPFMQGGLAPFASMGCEVQNQSSTGTYTPTMTGTGGGSGYSLVSSWQITVPTAFGPMYVRNPRYDDLRHGGDFPDTTGQSGKALVATSTKGLLAFATVGGGSVTSVAMTGDGTVFNSSVTGSPVTTSGTLAPSLHTQSANTVLAGPTSGSAAAPTFRALTNPDLGIPGTFQAGFPAIATAQTAFAIVSNSMTFGADFASIGGIASSVKCGTNPSGSVTFTLTDATTSTTLGTIVVSSSCVGTFATTSHTTKAVSANDFLNLSSGTDATAANIAFNLRATRN